MNKFTRKCIGISAIIGLLLITTLFKISYMVGSWTSFFSLRNCITPLAGAFGGFGGSLLVFGLYSVIRLYFRFSFWRLFINHIPSLFASWYWVFNHWLARVMVPALCMVLFVIHPIGCKAFVYSLYWLIPICLYLFKKDQNSIFLQSLGSTFVAHAVGSVVWLYAMPMPVWQWYALIPIVAIERLLFATGMYAIHKLISFVVAWRSQKQKISLYGNKVSS